MRNLSVRARGMLLGFAFRVPVSFDDGGRAAELGGELHRLERVAREREDGRFGDGDASEADACLTADLADPVLAAVFDVRRGAGVLGFAGPLNAAAVRPSRSGALSRLNETRRRRDDRDFERLGRDGRTTSGVGLGRAGGPMN